MHSFIPFSFHFLNFLPLDLQTTFSLNQLFPSLQILDTVPTVFFPAPDEGGTGAHSHELFLQNTTKYFMSKHYEKKCSGTLKFK